jgi:Calcineurin-like phosphoesterase
MKINNLKTDSLYFAGDSHGSYKSIFDWNNGNENSIAIHVGDACYPEIEIQKFSRRLKQKNNKLFIVKGNHEYFDLFDREAIFEDSVFYCKDYSILNINDKNFLLVGGAISIDRQYRIKEKLLNPRKETFYRKDEPIFLHPEVELIRDISYLVTHTAPRRWIPFLNPSFVNEWAKNDPELIKDLDRENETVSDLFEIVKKNNPLIGVFAGHFHRHIVSEEDGVKINILAIDEIKQLTFAQDVV